MNYTFLPQIERNKLKREYRIRASVVSLFVLSVVMIIGIAALFPTFISSKIVEKNELARIAEINKTNNESGLEIIKTQLNRDNILMNSVEDAVSTPTFYTAVKDIVTAKGSVKLYSIAVTGFSTTTIDVVIQGLAPSRDSLIAFKNRLETSLPGSSANLPLSDLAKNKDIQFSLKFTYSI